MNKKIAMLDAAFFNTSHQQISMTLFHGYRLGLSICLLLFPLLGLLPQDHDIVLYLFAVGIYITLSLIAVFMTRAEEVKFETFAILIADLIGLGILVHATGGISYGFATLMVISIALGSLVLKSKASYVLAATASIILIIDALWATFSQLGITESTYTQTGLYGLTFFVAAFIGHVLSVRLMKSEEIAREQKENILALESINEEIIQNLATGIIVLDQNFQALALNDKAWQLLESATIPLPEHLDKISPELHQALQDSANGTQFNLELAKAVTIKNNKLPHSLLYISLEDHDILKKQAQDLKLASLGRFTASIAHEVRNPLYAIHHAVQLLEEQIDKEEDIKLLTIIREHCVRLNAIVSNILELSQQRVPNIRNFNLVEWLEHFTEKFISTSGDTGTIEFKHEMERLTIAFDDLQLTQILTNLVENGLRESKADTDKGKVTIYLEKAVDVPYCIRVVDNGKGISLEEKEKVFEPFYTTRANGTGLGLYISKVLAQANNAQLAYDEHYKDGTCFVLKMTNI